MDRFSDRHIGPSPEETASMLDAIGSQSVDTLMDETVPASIRINKELDVPEALSEFEYLRALKKIADKNKIYRSYIGQGFYNTITPSVIKRTIFENPSWYTQYTPYQAEISQGRLEALLNFQTMVADLTGMPLANASLLDEGTAAAEGMAMAYGIANKRTKTPIVKFFVDSNVYTHTKSVIQGKAAPLGIELVEGDYNEVTIDESFFGAIIQYPDKLGSVNNYKSFCDKLHNQNQLVVVAADLMSLTMIASPGSWGADIVVGNTQRFGVPLGYGGPHAAYFATSEKYKRQIPGRIIGISKDRYGDTALRMALQTREQHIKREKATSNICTAQALLAIMASMYACYHGPQGLRSIGEEIHKKTKDLHHYLKSHGYKVANNAFFDTLTIDVSADQQKSILERGIRKEINLFSTESSISISLDETVSTEDLEDIKEVFSGTSGEYSNGVPTGIPDGLQREIDYLTHPVFNSHHTETQMMRYIKSLESKDLSLVHTMIPLGSCTMKLNAATELIPVSWPEFANIHPFAPLDQTEGYQQIFDELSKYLSEITGFAGCTLQPNSGAQGEYTGLMLIRAYHLDRNEGHRNIVIIPSSAHGTNPASAVIAGMTVVVTACDEKGNIALDDLNEKIALHKGNIAAAMITYPSTHGVFEEDVIGICDAIHDAGGLVYMDGANMNAQVGLTSPGAIHADCCHLNLHKTFAIPHGGGGPGMGPVCVNEKLLPYLPGHDMVDYKTESPIRPVASAPWGSASILLISYGYIRLLGKKGLKQATEIAILNANYIKAKVEVGYDILYTGKNGRCAHELIVDLREFKEYDISAEDVAKRLIDYGFHAPTLSFPVPGTIMIEPTESESKAELDRFVDALLSIRKEIKMIASSVADSEDNVLNNAPHTLSEVSADNWNHKYSRSDAAYPLDYLRDGAKFWARVGRVDNAYGDRNLICTCPPISMYEESLEEVTG